MWNRNSTNTKALWYMMLLSIQFGIQPILTRRYTSKELPKSVVIFVQECCKFVMAWFMYNWVNRSNNNKKNSSNKKSNKNDLDDNHTVWTISSWCHVAMLPAGLYALQNVFALHAYQHLDALTFNVLNQTKTLSAALCCYFVLGSRQSSMQIVALFLLLGSALIMEQIVTWHGLVQLLTYQSSSQQQQQQPFNVSLLQVLQQDHFLQGVIPILLASFISGLAGALSQKNLQQSTSGGGGGGRDPYLFSMELCAASALWLLVGTFVQSVVTTGDGKTATSRDLLSTATVINPFLLGKIQDVIGSGWTLATFIPILTNSAGGILVGLVTKYAGSVQKGFALIFGIFLSGLVQQYMAMSSSSSTSGRVAPHQIVGGIMAAISLWMHATHPPRPKKVDKLE